MAYRVDISLPALADAEESYLWIKYQSPETAGDWYEGLLQAIFSLENFPLRCPIAPESDFVGREVRQLLYGKRPRIHRILFGIEEDSETGEDVVRIFRIWHSSRRRPTGDEIREGQVKEEPAK
ncbi:MAG: type II toxin-antitoxin system RelE/ParE family toxin [Blastocatellales bacterium]